MCYFARSGSVTRVFTEAKPSGHGPDGSKNYPKNLWEAALGCGALLVNRQQRGQFVKRVFVATDLPLLRQPVRSAYNG